MGLYKINIEQFEEKGRVGIISPSSISGYVFSKIVTSINRLKLQGKYTSTIFINVSLLEYFMDSSSYVITPIGGITGDPDTIAPVGMLMGHHVFITPQLSDYEYFLGSEKDLEIYKRKDKITKILQR